MSIKIKALFICVCFFLCTSLFNVVQGCGGSSSSGNSRQNGMSRRYLNWDTKFLESFSWVCKGTKESIWNIQSAHENHHDDRVWGYHCRHNPYITTTCAWSLPNNQYLNDYNGNVNFICPRNGYIEGMHANTFSNVYNDRRFDFKCCDGTRLRRNCKWTSYVNNWDGDMNYDVPSGYYLAGAYSYHINDYQDRRWKFYICQ
ncbi:hemagglutinin/amebocyte aggregation factor-like [Actinia tenebrosa]|uniref:Hemagglutinin/amebocyte aggregation factor-like n=1 Tax=Actinia tenebrosa TaxID=6105 RepID=A0A6P8HLL2_ACTTE|nr:hemagglutinin/amebocyte aggregation factor-like [Actinia tenebrosa]